jgi:hypothetical protein
MIAPSHPHLREYLAAVGTLPGARFCEEDGIAWCTAPIGWPMFNGVLATPEGLPATAERAIGEVVAHGLPWFLWELPDTPPAVVDAATAAGAERFDDRAPWVEAQVAGLPDPAVPAGVTIEEVVDEDGHRTWARTLRECYGFPPAGEEMWLEPGRLCGWTGLPWRQWVAYADGTPVGVAMLFCGGGVAGLYGVGTLERARRRGIGRLLTLVPLKDSGQPVTGFFATPDGLALYDTLGFEPNGFVTRHLGGMSAPPELDAARG